MAWLFERTIEVAAWIAMLAAWVAAGLTVYGLVEFFRTWSDGTMNLDLLGDTGMMAGTSVAFALALGGLACIDRFVYDADKHK
jgi:hypothetical protein